MLSISDFIKPKSVKFLNSGLLLSYNNRSEVMSLSVGNYDIGIGVELPSLEIVNFLDATMDDANCGSMNQSAWENPIVKDLSKRLGSSKKLSISYYVMMTFLRLARTRDIWLAFRDIHHSLLSYLRNQAIVTKMLMQYKVALLSCHLAGYGLADLAKIEKTFENCGLHRNNYIFYVMFLLDGYAENLDFDTDVCVLSVAEMELETQSFINNSSTVKLCNYHAYSHLEWIVKANRMSYGEMANELSMATQIAYTTIRPFRSKEYGENYARRAMTNTVNRIHHAYSKYPSKKRMMKQDGFNQNTQMQINEAAISTKNIDPSFHHALTSNLNFSEDSMIEHLDKYRAAA